MENKLENKVKNEIESNVENVVKTEMEVKEKPEENKKSGGNKILAAVAVAAAALIGFLALGNGTVANPLSSKKLSNQYVAVNQYKGFEIEERIPDEITDEQVEESIKMSVPSAATVHGVKEGVVKEGDFVLIDYDGSIDGKVFEGGSSDEYLLEIGSGSFIPGFEDQIVGHSPGDMFDVIVTFPEDYGDEALNGKEAVFNVKLRSIAPTELTDEIATFLGGEEMTVEEYRKKVREDLEQQEKDAAQSDYEFAVYNKFIDNCELKKIKDGDLEKWKKIVEDNYSMYAEMMGVTVEEFLTEFYQSSLEEQAKEQIVYQYATELIAKKEKIEVTDEEYNKKVEELASTGGYETSEDYIKEYENIYGEGHLRKAMIQEKVMAFIVESSVAVEELDTEGYSDEELAEMGKVATEDGIVDIDETTDTTTNEEIETNSETEETSGTENVEETDNQKNEFTVEDNEEEVSETNETIEE